MTEKLPSLRIGGCESESPIFLGGMSVALTTSELAAAVANGGGYGTIGGIGLGMTSESKNPRDYFKANEDILRSEILAAREMSNDGNIGVNLMVAATDYENLVKTAVESGAKFIVSGAGLPLNLPELTEKYKVSGQEAPALIPIISSVKAANIIMKRWEKRYGVSPSAIIVENPNTAGGHLGVTNVNDIGKAEYDLESVVPDLIKNLEASGYDIPVIAAGGMWERADIDRMLKIGAKGVQMATRFLTVAECNASQDFKDRHLDNADPIVIIKSPVGMPGRAIENNFMKRLGYENVIDLGPCFGCLRQCGHRESGFKEGFCIMRALDNVRRGDTDNGVLFTGSNGDRLSDDRDNGLLYTRQIMDELTK
jgi:nitronate monooxygenase